ncbi:multidrug effflux MFS transporter [Paenibacillus herberti]|uniref:Bcr/CflA family efflux transporter n=1 Tax=Paenibacillus herberti TaxID=1619309 RepID=A0A229NUK1_9BACL|nr:multidrug effflux MFS transporter [Paenibacillus herberti]OXM13504.1 MFS transporter [Paenibacillus herberti]
MSSSSSNTADGVESASPAPAARRWGLAIMLGSLTAIGPFSLDMYLPALPELTRELGATDSLGQLSLTACLIGLALGQLLAGPLSDARGRRGPLLVSLGIYAAASLFSAFSSSIAMLLVCRLVQGLSGAAGIVIARAVVRDLYSGKEMTRFFAQLMLINGAAPILAPIFGAQLLRFVSWRGTFVFLALLGVVLFVSAMIALPETLPKERRVTGGLKGTVGNFGLFIKDRSFMGVVLTMSLVSGAMFAYISGSSFVLQGVYDVSASTYGFIFAANGVGIILASQLTGRLALRYSTERLFRIGVLIALCGGVSLLLSALLDVGLWAVLVSLFIVVSSVGIVGTCASSLAMENAGSAAGSASALLGMLQFLVGALLSPLSGLGGSGSALPLALVIACAHVLALASMFLLLGRQKTARQ